jgi:hypothetical protein
MYLPSFCAAKIVVHLPEGIDFLRQVIGITFDERRHVVSCEEVVNKHEEH